MALDQALHRQDYTASTKPTASGVHANLARHQSWQTPPNTRDQRDRWLANDLEGRLADRHDRSGAVALAACHTRASQLCDVRPEEGVTLDGTVHVSVTNPHAFIELDVAGGNGNRPGCSIELNSPNNLTRHGWAATSLRAATRSRPRGALRNGNPGGLFLDLKNLTARTRFVAAEDGTPVMCPTVT